MPSSADPLVQLLPADGWSAVYAEGDRAVVLPLLAWGLTRSGAVLALDVDPSSDVRAVTERRAFDRLVHERDLVDEVSASRSDAKTTNDAAETSDTRSSGDRS